MGTLARTSMRMAVELVGLPPHLQHTCSAQAGQQGNVSHATRLISETTLSLHTRDLSESRSTVRTQASRFFRPFFRPCYRISLLILTHMKAALFLVCSLAEVYCVTAGGAFKL